MYSKKQEIRNVADQEGKEGGKEEENNYLNFYSSNKSVTSFTSNHYITSLHPFQSGMDSPQPTHTV